MFILLLPLNSVDEQNLVCLGGIKLLDEVCVIRCKVNAGSTQAFRQVS